MFENLFRVYEKVLKFKESHESLRTFQEHFNKIIKCLSKSTKILKIIWTKPNSSHLMEMYKTQWCFQQKTNKNTSVISGATDKGASPLAWWIAFFKWFCQCECMDSDIGTG